MAFAARSVPTPVLLAAAAVLALGACERREPPAKPTGLAPTDYAPPPELTEATRDPSGALEIGGTGLPQARIRLASPSGAATGSTVAADGRWSATLPSSGEVRLLSLSQDIDGRVIRARGYVAVLPPPGATAAVLRPGAGARPATFGARTPAIGSVEFDGMGAGVVSGRARPGEQVRVFLDGQEAGEAQADPKGWFDVSLSEPLEPTGHSVIVSTPDGRAAQAFDATRAEPIATPPFAASRKTGAWRIDWMAPGGGVQTTLLFDPAGAGG